MRSHELARLLLEEPDAPVVGLDDYFGYFDLAAVFPVQLTRSTNQGKWMSELEVAKTPVEIKRSFLAIVIS